MLRDTHKYVGVFIMQKNHIAIIGKMVRGDTMYKNHEGYSDPTAGIAEKRAERTKKRKRSRGYPESGYRLNELYCFRLAARLIRGK